MAVIIETTLGDITVDLFLKERPRSSLNFLKLCKMKYYNFNLFHMVNRGFIAQTGDPTGSGEGGESIWGVIEGESKRYFEAEVNPRIKHTTAGLVSFVGDKNNMLGSQFFITLASDLTYLDAQHCIFGEVVEGFDVLHLLNEAICDNDHRPYQDIRITHTVILEDPFSDPKGIMIPDSSPEPTAIHLQGGRIAPDEDIDETAGKSAKEIAEIIADREAKARATILEMVGDIPDADMAPPENVLFVCKLNPVTNDDDLEIIFSRFGKIKSCEVIRDKKTGDSLQYAFVEFENEKSCEDAYFKMDNVLIDDRRIHVDFSQSVAKVRWFGKGRITYLNDNEDKNYAKSDLGNGKYQRSNKQKDSGHSIQNKIKRNDSDFDTYNLEKQKHSHSKTDKYQLSSDLKRNIKGSDKKYSRNDDTSNRRNRSKSKEKYDDDSGRAKISKYDRKDISAIKNVNEKLYETNKMHRKRRSRSREHVYNQKNRTDSEQREKSRRKHEKSDKYNKSKYEEKSRRSEMENKDYRTREPAKKLKSERSRKKKSRDSLSEEYSSTERTKSSAKHKKKSKRKHKSRSTSESSDS